MISNRHSLGFYGRAQSLYSNNRQGLGDNESATSMMDHLTQIMSDQQKMFSTFLKETTEFNKTIQEKVNTIQEEITSLWQDVATMKETQPEKSNGKRSSSRRLDTKLTVSIICKSC